MNQTTLCVPLDVNPDSCARLVSLIEALKQQEDDRTDKSKPNFARLIERVPLLHCMSMSVFLDADYDPIFIIEANFDGPPGPFWAQLEALIGENLRHMIRCCKRPRDSTSELYDVVTGRSSIGSIAPYLEARTQSPSVFHHGNRGLTRAQIFAEQRLFLDLAREIDPPRGASPYRGIPADQTHQKLRTAMLALPNGPHAWLRDQAQPRISAWENAADKAKLGAFAIFVLALLATPGLLLVGLDPGPEIGWTVAILCLLVLLLLAGRAIADRPVASAGALTGAASVAVGWLAIWADIGRGWLLVVMALSSVVFVLAVLVLWLRGLELRDSAQDSPVLNERIRRKMLRREDWVTQNHMGSIVLIKPGVLRAILIHVGHWGLNLLLKARIDSRAGYLGSMRTVHFAHWAFLNNDSRLLFCSNFDHSWDSYLDDFIEKAHGGLTLAWSCGVGFPPTRLLLGEGATQGRKFKSWALASRTVSRFWFSAYPDLTVDQIERHHRIANGLRKAQLTKPEALQWMRDL
ncbi:MAG TPA: hypothetical protein VGV17_24550 [Bosea sp. (in: a-proteobacteria)]|jgi:hypothetical protein|uniref:hypothetical protein n=1 Tax=Bosea sp. (in: a-proteobacteria) TaxID=1871050 RepID=UPI002DDCBC39|nr:hypothetical protein [Bosea sp. (in: a-proteobacteria)]HEV2556933.1 hypothetical protein [Bosea sp. (in: a-proteobacteria)]